VRSAVTSVLSATVELTAQVWRAWQEDYATSMGAALAYYTLFSLAPLLLIVVSVAGLAFGQEAARGEIQVQLDTLMGPGSAGAVQSLLASVHEPAKGWLATVVGLVLLVAGASSVFGEIQSALDRIWRVPVVRSKRGWLAPVRSRLLSFGMILVLGFLLTVSLLASAVLAALGRGLDPLLGDWHWIVHFGNGVGGLALAAVVFALIFKLMPRVHVKWTDVWIGALFTAVLFTLGKTLIGWYIGRSGVVSGFGAAGSLVVVLLWVYYSAQILLVGAEFTWVYANRFGSRNGAKTAEPVQVH
jgi:membrane protein